MTSGAPSGNGCPGSISAIERLDFPGLCLADAGNGLRATDFVSSFPSGIHVAARYVEMSFASLATSSINPRIPQLEQELDPPTR